MKIQEQNCRREKSSVKADNKRHTNRAMRRAAKRNPENADRKPRFRGYTS